MEQILQKISKENGAYYAHMAIIANRLGKKLSANEENILYQEDIILNESDLDDKN